MPPPLRTPYGHPAVGGKAPMKGRRASASKAGAAQHAGAEAHEDLPELEVEDFGPPDWRTVLNRRADLGYPDFYPSRPGFHQTEDVLTEEFVKNGFSAKTFVAIGAESFSMHGPIHNHLLNGCMDMLNRLGQEVAQKRDEGMAQIGERAFRIPVRVTYNDTKRFQFLADLANPAVPLHRLMRNPVPHGFKGVELLDTMFAPPLGPGASHNRTPSGSGPPTPPEPIPLERAFWFIRVLGANEITAHRGRAQPVVAPVAAPSPAAATPSSTNTAVAAPTLVLSSNDWYTQEFTNLFTLWLRNQLGQLNLPNRGPAKNTIPAPKAAINVLADDKARTRWLAKWDYSTKLLRELHSGHLLSARIFCNWLADTLGAANLAQLGFVGQLIGDYLPDMVRHVATGRICVRAACEKLREIQICPAASSLANVDRMLRLLVTTIVDAAPDVLVSPPTWRNHADTLEKVLFPPSENGAELAAPSDRLLHQRRRLVTEMKRRSDALFFHPAATESTTSPRRQQMEDLQKLDAMNGDTDMTHLCKTYFDGTASPLSTTIDLARLEEKAFVLLNWSMGLFQLGVHRGYAVHTLLIIWNRLYEQNTAKSPDEGDFDFFPILYKWLDTSEAARKEENAFAIGLTFGELTRQGFFSYGRYIKMLIAAGHSARSRPHDKPPSHHLPLLAAMPIFVQAKDLLQQRRLALCGDDSEAGKRMDLHEEQLMENFKEEVKEYVPEVFGWKRYGRSATLKESVNHQMASAAALSRHMFLQARFWLAPAATANLQQRTKRPAMNASTFVRVIHIFHLCSGYSTIADFLIKALERSENEEILCIVIDMVRRAADVWTAMDRWEPLIDALMERNHAQDRRQQHHAGLAHLLVELAERGKLSEDDEEDVRNSVDAHAMDVDDDAVSWVDAQQSMGALHQAISTANIQAAAIISTKLASRHGPFKRWSGTWWTTINKAIQASDPAQSSSVVNAALAHIEGVVDQVEGQLDKPVSDWLNDLSQAKVAELMGGKASITLYTVLLNLIAHRKLRIVPALLAKLVFPAWKQAATAALAAKGHFSGKYTRLIESTVIFAAHLLLTVPHDTSLPPINLRQSLVLQTEREKAIDATNVPLLIRHLPALVVLNVAKNAPEQLRKHLTNFLQALAMTPQFKAAAFRHLNVLKDAFLSNEWSKPSLDSALESGMVDTLKLIMSQGSSASSKSLHNIASLDSSSRFSAWRWTSIVLGMRVEFKRLAMRIENGDEAEEARQTLNQLVHATLDRDATADDTDLLCEAFRGIEALAAQEIVAVGLERLTALLSQIISAESQNTLEVASRGIDLMLRVLDSANLAQSREPAESSVLSARHALIDLISVALQAIERQIVSENQDAQQLIDGVTPPQVGHVLGVILNLLKFIFGLAIVDGISPLTPKPDFGRLTGTFLRVISAVAPSANGMTMTLLTDMLSYIVESAPATSRPSIHVALMIESISVGTLRALAARPSLYNVLPPTSPLRRPFALKHPGQVDDGGPETLLSLDDRPWEMFEQLNPPPARPGPGEQFLASKPIRDTASISVSLFAPRIKRDAVPDCWPPKPRVDDGKDTSDSEDEFVPHDYASERNLGDGFAGEPQAVRQLASHLYEGPEEATVEDDITIIKRDANSPAGASTPTAPPTRRASVRLASGKTTRESITISDDEDSDDDDDSDDDVADAPAQKRPRTGGKTTAQSTFGGKTVRKTTGGKSVARKNVGGKAVRGTGGKTTRGYGQKAPSRR